MAFTKADLSRMYSAFEAASNLSSTRSLALGSREFAASRRAAHFAAEDSFASSARPLEMESKAAAAFAAVRTDLDTSGNLVEYMIYDDHSGLSIAYDPIGALGDYTTKFRPWEGGIVAEAVLRYLVGFRPDATSQGITLRPHLPAGWPRMAFRGLRAGGERFDLVVERSVAGEAVVQVTRRAGSADVTAWRLAMRWDAPSGAPEFAVDGVPVATDAVQRWTSLFQTTSAQTPAIDLAPGATVAIRVRAQGL